MATTWGLLHELLHMDLIVAGSVSLNLTLLFTILVSAILLITSTSEFSISAFISKRARTYPFILNITMISYSISTSMLVGLAASTKNINYDKHSITLLLMQISPLLCGLIIVFPLPTVENGLSLQEYIGIVGEVESLNKFNGLTYLTIKSQKVGKFLHYFWIIIGYFLGLISIIIWWVREETSTTKNWSFYMIGLSISCMTIFGGIEIMILLKIIDSNKKNLNKIQTFFELISILSLFLTITFINLIYSDLLSNY